MDNKDVIITGTLENSEIEKAITELVRKIEANTSKIANSYDKTISKIEEGMKGVTTLQTSVVKGIEAEVAASKRLAETLDKLNRVRERGKKIEKKESKESVLGMPINTEQAIEAKLKALEKLRKVTPVSSLDFVEIKKEYSILKKFKDEISKTEEEREKEKRRAEREILKEQERATRETVRAEREITAERKKRRALDKQRGTKVADSVLGLHERDIDEMDKKVRYLIKSQKYLSDKGLLSQPKINQMTRAIDRLQAKIKELRKKNNISTLTKESVFAMPETTLSEISAKMKALSDYRASVKINSSEIATLNATYARLEEAQRKALGGATKLEKQNKSLAKTFKNLSERVAFYFGLGAIMGFVRKLYEIRGEYELIERSIGVLIDDMNKGSMIFREMQAKAKESPYTLIELASTTKQLAAYNFSQKEIINTTSKLADISSALNVPIERLVYNLGQIKAQDVLNARDARDFANAGLAIVPMLAKMYSEQEKRLVSTAEVYDRMKKKMVSYADVLKVIYSITDDGGKFYDFQAKQAETLKVKIANLSLAYNDMLNEMGKENSGLLTFFVNTPKIIFENWKKIDTILWDVITVLGTYKGLQLILNKVIGKGTFNIIAQVNAEKRDAALKLRKIALYRQLTAEEQKQLLMTKKITSENIAASLSSKNLTESQAMWLLVSQRMRGVSKRNLVLLRTSLIEMGLLNKAQVKLALSSKILTATLRSLWLSITTLGKAALAYFFNPITLIFTAITSIYTIYSKISEAKKEIDDFNKSVRESAKETAKTIEKFSNENVETLSKIGKVKIQDSEALKIWETLKEQIQGATLEGENFIEKLSHIDDINERLVEAKKTLQEISLSEKIIADYNNSLQYNAGGFFDESLVEDLKDLASFYGIYKREKKELTEGDSYKNAREEAEKEIKKFSDSIIRIINERGIKSETAIRTILSKYKQIFIENNELSGYAADYFNISVDEKVLGKFNIEARASLWKKLMDVIKRDSSAAFADISDDMLKNINSFNELPLAMQNAVFKAQEELKRQFPDYADEINKMILEANTNIQPFVFQVRLNFDVRQDSELQKIFNKEVLGKNNKDFSLLSKESIDRLGKYIPKNQESFFEYGENLRSRYNDLSKKANSYKSQIEKLKKSGKSFESLNNLLKSTEQGVKDVISIADRLGYSLKSEKDRKKESARGQSELSKAIKEQLQLIDKLNSAYNTMNKEGMAHDNILKQLTNDYKKQISLINPILKKNGITPFNINDFAGKDVKQQKAYLETLREQVLKTKDTSAYQQVVLLLEKLGVNASVYDIQQSEKNIETTLNQLTKIYELSKELQENPQMKNFFEVIGYNNKELITNSEDTIKKINEVVKKETKGLVSDILSDDIQQIAKKAGIDVSSNLVKTLLKTQNEARKIRKEDTREQIKLLDEYIAKYGNLQQKIANINEVQNEKIRIARVNKDENRALAETAKKEEMLGKVEAEVISRKIDWYSVFQNLGLVMRNQLTPLLGELKAYISSAKFKGSPAADQKNIIEAMSNIRKSIGSTSDLGWRDLANSIYEFQEAERKLLEIKKEEAQITEKINNLKSRGESTQQAELELKAKNFERYNAENQVIAANQKLASTTQDVMQPISEVTAFLKESTIPQLGELFTAIDKLRGAFAAKKATKGLSMEDWSENERKKMLKNLLGIDLEKKGNKPLSKSLDELGIKAQIIAAILDILNLLKEGIGQLLANLVDMVLNATSGILRDLFSGNILKKPFDSIRKGLLDIGDAVTFGRMSKWFGVGGNTKEIAELTEKLTKSNERLQKSIDYLSEVVGDSAGAKAIYASEKAIEAQIEVDKNTKNIWIAQMNRHGSHHSNAYYFNDEYFAQWEEDIKNALKAAGLNERSIKSWADVQTLSAEEMAAIRAFAPTAFKYLEDVGEYNVSEHLNKFADLAGEIEKLENKIRENLTQTSFSSMRESFLTALVEMKKDAKEFGNDFKNIFFKSMINAFVLNDEFDKWLKDFQQRWAEKIKNGDMNRTDWNNFNNEYINKYEELMNITQGLADKIGFKGGKELDLSSLQKGIQSITEDTGGAIEAYLNGISAQVYLGNDKLQELINLTQVNTGSNSEIIQLMKNNLEAVNVIKNTILDCLSSNSRALKVELIN